MLLYFAYGANMHPDHMRDRVPGAKVVGPGSVGGFRLSFSVFSTEWQGGAANLEPDDQSHVWGVLWEVPEDQWQGLDAYQGHPTFFRREDVPVDGPNGPAVAWTYRVAHQTGTFVRPTDAYVQLLHSAMRLQGLPPEALDAVDHAARPPKPQIST